MRHLVDRGHQVDVQILDKEVSTSLTPNKGQIIWTGYEHLYLSSTARATSKYCFDARVHCLVLEPQ